jgi:hypothetical protein
MKRLKGLLKDKSGSGELMIVVLFMIGMIVFSVAFEYIRVQIYASNIRDSFERAIRAVASENYNEVYAPFRELESSGGEYVGGAAGGGNRNETPEWIPMNDIGDVHDELLELLTLEEQLENDKLIGDYKYELSDIEVYVKNAAASASGKYEVQGYIKVKLPIYFLGVIEQNVTFQLKVKTAYTAKY